MLVDIALGKAESCFVRPCEDGSSVVSISEAVIRRAYCELVTQEVERRRGRLVAAHTKTFGLGPENHDGIALSAQGGLKS